MLKIEPVPLHCPCHGAYFKEVFTYTAPPAWEVRFQFSAGAEYRRQILQCSLCEHYISVHQMDPSALYGGDYVDSTYTDDAGIARNFERIMALGPSKSDNVQRVQRVLNFAAEHFPDNAFLDRPPSILDVGSGLCVFLHRMKEAGWDCTALDPDPRAVRHAEGRVGVRAVGGGFLTIDGLGTFYVVTFNKVLEHVPDPVTMLRKALKHLRPCGFAYVEVPDGQVAATQGPEREEFFIDHLHVFSDTSLALLAGRAGFRIAALERLCEPSGKYTLRGFLTSTFPSTEAD